MHGDVGAIARQLKCDRAAEPGGGSRQHLVIKGGAPA
jgi:hypothetical protein